MMTEKKISKTITDMNESIKTFANKEWVVEELEKKANEYKIAKLLDKVSKLTTALDPLIKNSD
jgi:hypothetical protein